MSGSARSPRPARGSVEEVADHQASGVFDYALTKPVNMDRLTAILFQQA